MEPAHVGCCPIHTETAQQEGYSQSQSIPTGMQLAGWVLLLIAGWAIGRGNSQGNASIEVKGAVRRSPGRVVTPYASHRFDGPQAR